MTYTEMRDLPNGTPLRMTAAAIGQHLQGRNNRRTGKLMGPAYLPNCMIVLRDGGKTRERYNCSFWEVTT